MKKFSVGIVGAGTVGRGVVEILTTKFSQIETRSGITLHLKMICDKDESLKSKYPEVQFTQDYKQVTENPEIDLVVELVGGTKIAYEIVKSAIENHKTVVTANKALLAEKGDELFSLAKKNQVEIGYEASVAGTIPIIRSIKTGLISNDFLGVYGILNGTTNFILTKMEEENMEYEQALETAQKLGFAEKDPTFDVEGIDAAHKLTLLASLAFDSKIETVDVSVEGITKITKSEIQTAKQLGYRIKLLGVCKNDNNQITARVAPTMIPLSHPIANIKNEMNAIYVETNFSGSLMFSGRGAGSLPTASAVVSDIVYYASRIFDKPNEKNFFENNLFPKRKVLKETNRDEKFYLRFNTKDEPGVLAEISRILGNNKISISTMHQNESDSDQVEVIILTHPCNESKLRDAIKSIDELKHIIISPTVALRVENLI
ncbi:MAG: homoserine dehydrogenase [Leptospiraceae bacterium]|nr:homoserine dehydrogenase [Leptospiraceae bacterium]